MRYREQLLDPRWQKKRLKILERDEFTCVACGATDKTLHVDHGYYAQGKMAWDYPESTLHTVCADCHVMWQRAREGLGLMVAMMFPHSLYMVRHASLEALKAYRDAGVAGPGLTPEDAAVISGTHNEVDEWIITAMERFHLVWTCTNQNCSRSSRESS